MSHDLRVRRIKSKCCCYCGEQAKHNKGSLCPLTPELPMTHFPRIWHRVEDGSGPVIGGGVLPSDKESLGDPLTAIMVSLVPSVATALFKWHLGSNERERRLKELEQSGWDHAKAIDSKAISDIANARRGKDQICIHPASLKCVDHESCWLCCPKSRVCFDHAKGVIELRKLVQEDKLPVGSMKPEAKRVSVWLDADGKVCCKRQNFFHLYQKKLKEGKWKKIEGKPDPVPCDFADCKLSHAPSVRSRVATAKSVMYKNTEAKHVLPKMGMAYLGQVCVKWLRGRCVDAKCTYAHVHLPLCPAFVDKIQCDGFCKKRHYYIRGDAQLEKYLRKFDLALRAFADRLKHEGYTEPAVRKAAAAFTARLRQRLRAIRHSGPRQYKHSGNAWTNTSAPDDDVVVVSRDQARRFEELVRLAREDIMDGVLRGQKLAYEFDQKSFDSFMKWCLKEENFTPAMQKEFVQIMRDFEFEVQNDMADFIYDTYRMEGNDPNTWDESEWEEAWGEWKGDQWSHYESLVTSNPTVSPNDVVPFVGRVFTDSVKPQFVNATYAAFNGKSGVYVVKHAFDTPKSDTGVLHFGQQEYKLNVVDAVRVANDLYFFPLAVSGYSCASFDDYETDLMNVPAALWYFMPDGTMKTSMGKIPLLNDAVLVPYTCSSENGACSAPVWSLRKGKPKLVGFHNSGGFNGRENYFIPATKAFRDRSKAGQAFLN